jgi:hypothetical protein
MVEAAPDLQPGRVVKVRQRQYLVEEVVAPATADDATLVRLSCLDDDAQGQSLAVFWEAELDAEVLTGCGWDHLAKRGFDPPKLFSAYLHTLRWNCVTATNPHLFQAPYRAGIRIDHYQIEPLRPQRRRISQTCHLAGREARASLRTLWHLLEGRCFAELNVFERNRKL